MAELTETKLGWKGKESLVAILPRLAPSQRIEIELPVDYNHALFVRLGPDGPTTEPENLNIEGDIELLTQIARIKGLEDLADLIEPLSRMAVEVTVSSPPPRIVIVAR